MNNTKSTIMQIFHNEIGTFEHIGITSKYKELLNVVIDCEEQLMKALNDHSEILELYKKMEKAVDDLNLEISDNYYETGFKLGFKLGFEIND